MTKEEMKEALAAGIIAVVIAVMAGLGIIAVGAAVLIVGGAIK